MLKSNNLPGQLTVFIPFPKDEALRKEWSVKMNRYDPTTTKRLWQPQAHDVSCSKHFEESCFTERSRLTKHLGLNYKTTLCLLMRFQHCSATLKPPEHVNREQLTDVPPLQNGNARNGSAVFLIFNFLIPFSNRSAVHLNLS